MILCFSIHMFSIRHIIILIPDSLMRVNAARLLRSLAPPAGIKVPRISSKAELHIDMAKFLSQDQINEYKECFSLYDQKRSGKMKTQDLLTVMRSLGRCPTLPELDRHLLTHKIDKSGELDFSTFLSVMHAQIRRENPRDEILRAVRLMDTEKRGFVTAPELRLRLTGFGERLTDQEVDELLSDAGVACDGQIRYEDFSKMVALLTADEEQASDQQYISLTQP